MLIDADLLLLDRVFQPTADRAAARVTCFDLARLSLLAVIALHTVVFVRDLIALSDPLLLALLTGGTLIAYAAASNMQQHVDRAERRSRSGTEGAQRMAFRPLRLLWLVIAAGAIALEASSFGRAIDWCNAALPAAWLSTVYFSSCVPMPPRQRTTPADAALMPGAA